MNNLHYNIPNWELYNQALIEWRSLTFCMDHEAIQLWNQIKQSNHGRLRLFRDLAITTAFIVKRVFSTLLRCQTGFIHFIFNLAELLLSCPKIINELINAQKFIFFCMHLPALLISIPLARSFVFNLSSDKKILI